MGAVFWSIPGIDVDLHAFKCPTQEAHGGCLTNSFGILSARPLGPVGLSRAVAPQCAAGAPAGMEDGEARIPWPSWEEVEEQERAAAAALAAASGGALRCTAAHGLVPCAGSGKQLRPVKELRLLLLE